MGGWPVAVLDGAPDSFEEGPMRIRAHATVAVVLLLLLAVFQPSGGAIAVDRCGDRADAELSRSRTWADLHRWFRAFFPDCDDGYLAEGVSEFVTALLAKDWSNLRKLDRETRADADFEHFVLTHIDATADSGNLRVILDNARNRCPQRLAKICASIETAVENALQEGGALEPRPLEPNAYLLPVSETSSALAQCSRSVPKSTGTWSPTLQDMALAERDLDKIGRLRANCCVRGARIRDPRNFIRQYVGIVLGSRKVLYINAFPIELPSRGLEQLGQKAMVACDGGPGYWGVVYDPQTRRFEDLSVNGLA